MIAEQYGDDQELQLEVDFRMPRIHFGLTDKDMTGVVTLKLGIKLYGNQNYIIYDEIDIHTAGDMEILEEVLIGNMADLTVDRAKLSDTTRTKPIYDTMDVTEEQYAAFWTYAEGAARRW